MTQLRIAAYIAVLGGVMTAGCAAPQMDAAWANPEYKGRSLRGAPVLVACEASEPTLQRICEDQVAQQVAARGAKPTLNSQLREAAVPPPGATDPYLVAARRIGAQAVVRTTLQAGQPIIADAGPRIGFGLGGGSGRVGGGAGISLPIGGARAAHPYLAETAVIDSSNGAVMWSGRASSAGGQDISAQLSELTATTARAMQGAGLF